MQVLACDDISNDTGLSGIHKSTDALLARLLYYHGSDRDRASQPTVVEIVADIVDEGPVAVESVTSVWVERQREYWFSIEEEIDPPRPVRPQIKDIIKATAKHYGVTSSDILSARRTANVVRPRQVAYYLSKTLTLRSLPEIGRKIGGRDHTSILSGIRKMERLRATDTALANDIAAIASTLGGMA